MPLTDYPPVVSRAVSTSSAALLSAGDLDGITPRSILVIADKNNTDEIDVAMRAVATSGASKGITLGAGMSVEFPLGGKGSALNLQAISHGGTQLVSIMFNH